jgi:hypothetical protein
LAKGIPVLGCGEAIGTAVSIVEGDDTEGWVANVKLALSHATDLKPGTQVNANGKPSLVIAQEGGQVTIEEMAAREVTKRIPHPGKPAFFDEIQISYELDLTGKRHSVSRDEIEMHVNAEPVCVALPGADF